MTFLLWAQDRSPGLTWSEAASRRISNRNVSAELQQPDERIGNKTFDTGFEYHALTPSASLR